MKTPLVLLLALSLAGNAVLAVRSFRSSNSAANATTAGSGAAATTAAASGSAAPATTAAATPAVHVSPDVWPALRPNGNLKTLVANLRAAGFPPAVVRAVTNQMISEQLGPAGTNLPFWKQTSANPEYLAEQQQLNSRRLELFQDLLGPDARPSVTMDAATRERRFGQLSDDKVDKIEALNRDINDLRSKMYAERKSGDFQSVMSAQAAAEQEQRAELAAILTPAELEQYEMRSSSAASRVMTNVKGIDITEAEYAALFRAQKAFESADPTRTGGALNQESMALRNAAQEEVNQQARAVLTDDRFYEYLKAADPSYARIAQFASNYSNITPAMTYELSQIERNYQTSMMTLARPLAGSNTMPSAERMAPLMAARKEYQEKLTTLLGAETATAYQQRNRSTGGVVTAVAKPGGP